FAEALDVGLQAECSLIAVLGSPGRSGTAHVVQFGPIGVEGGRKEVPPEGLETGKAGLSGAAGGQGGEGGGNHRSHDANSLFSVAAWAALMRFCALRTSFRFIY